MEDSESPPGAALTACQRCRKQKLRCSRDLPICKRCRGVSTVCEYPPLPDRKLLAAQRLQRSKSRTTKEPDHDRSPQRQQAHAAVGESFSTGRSGPHHSYALQQQPQQHPHPHPHPRAPTPPLLASLRRTVLPSPEVAIFLFEIYFSRLHNANLLFHKQKFLSQYAANTIPDFVALSIFALASIFLNPSSEQSPQGDEEDRIDLGISNLSDLGSAKQGLEWATAASQRALMQADVPRLETVQACQNLVLYWFSRGETNRVNIHHTIAYRTSRLLSLHIQHQSSGDANTSDLFCELERRCFWSCWITCCISQENADFKGKPWKEAIGLAFPSDEDSFALGVPSLGEYFDVDGAIQAPSPNLTRSPSIMGEFVKLYSLWWEIQNFVKQHKASQPSDATSAIATLFELDRRLSLVFEKIHPDFRLQTAASFSSPKVDPFRLFSLHSLYHLCACALHTSIVPLFSETPSPLVSKKVIHVSAEESVKHAAVMLDMANIFLSTRPDLSRLPSITGYAMFVACAVHFKSLLIQNKLQSHGTGRFRGAISILEGLKLYWATNNTLWSSLKRIFALESINIDMISQGYCHSRTEEQSTDVEKIVSHELSPNENERTDIYTYIAPEEAKGISPRHDSGASPKASEISVQHTPSSSNASVPNIEANLIPLHRVTNSAELRQVNLDARNYMQPHQPNPTRPPQPSFTDDQPPPPGDESSFIATHQAIQGGLLSIPMGNASGFGPSATSAAVAEEHQMQGPSQTMNYEARPGFGQGTNGFDDIIGFMGTEMEIDGANFWWDQVYGGAAFQEDLGENISNSRTPYSFETFSFT